VSEAERERWVRVEALLDELLDLEAARRAEAPRRARDADPEVAAQAAELLQAIRDEDAPLLDVPIFVSSPELVEKATADASGTR